MMLHGIAEDRNEVAITPLPDGASEPVALRQVRLELAHERDRRLQAEWRAAMAEERALAAEERRLVAEWLVAVLRSELTGVAPRRRHWWWPWSRR
jgi:hypothetical protein